METSREGDERNKVVIRQSKSKIRRKQILNVGKSCLRAIGRIVDH